MAQALETGAVIVALMALCVTGIALVTFVRRFGGEDR